MELDTSSLPRGEENHTVFCVGMIMDNIEEKLSDETVFDFDIENVGDVEVVSFTPIYLFAWKTRSAVYLRSKQLLFSTYLVPLAELMKLELCFDDNHELDTVINCCKAGGVFDCKLHLPTCVSVELLEQAKAGLVHKEHFSQIRRLGKFYLENVFHYNFYELDSENRSIVHYLAWTGKDDSLADMLEVIPSLANLQDEYGETPLMLAVRGGKPC